MSNHSSKPLRTSERKAQWHNKVREQARFRAAMLFVVIVLTLIFDTIVLHSGLLITFGVAVGAALNWVAQTLFTGLVFRINQARVRQNIVNQLYIGQLVKWLVTILGFALIFTILRSPPTFAILLGYIVMQLVHFIGLWRIR